MTLVRMFMDAGAFNHPEFVDVLYRVGVCDTRGRKGAEESSVAVLARLHVAWDAARATRFVDVFPEGETNVNKIKEGLYRARIRNVAIAIKEQFDTLA